MVEMQLETTLQIKGDSTACHGTLHREGCGNVKHLELKQLWLQEREREKELEIRKVLEISTSQKCLLITGLDRWEI